MIWVIANKIEEDGSFPTYRYYKKAFDDSEVDIYCAGQNDDFSFLKKEDIALVRTRDRNIGEALRKAQSGIGFKSTLESEETELLTSDKDIVKEYLQIGGIRHPKTIKFSRLEDGKRYFVKPKYGENSIGIDENSLCENRVQAIKKYTSLLQRGIEPIIEEYIEGFDVTVSAIFDPKTGMLRTDAIRFRDDGLGFQTPEYKDRFVYDDSSPCDAVAYDDLEVDCLTREIFRIVKAKYYLRVDFRVRDGVPYVIDVNMIPGLAPNGYTSMCLRTHGVGYHDMVRMVVNSALR